MREGEKLLASPLRRQVNDLLRHIVADHRDGSLCDASCDSIKYTFGEGRPTRMMRDLHYKLRRKGLGDPLKSMAALLPREVVLEMLPLFSQETFESTSVKLLGPHETFALVTRWATILDGPTLCAGEHYLDHVRSTWMTIEGAIQCEGLDGLVDTSKAGEDMVDLAEACLRTSPSKAIKALNLLSQREQDLEAYSTEIEGDHVIRDGEFVIACLNQVGICVIYHPSYGLGMTERAALTGAASLALAEYGRVTAAHVGSNPHMIGLRDMGKTIREYYYTDPENTPSTVKSVAGLFISWINLASCECPETDSFDKILDEVATDLGSTVYAGQLLGGSEESVGLRAWINGHTAMAQGARHLPPRKRADCVDYLNAVFQYERSLLYEIPDDHLGFSKVKSQSLDNQTPLMKEIGPTYASAAVTRLLATSPSSGESLPSYLKASERKFTETLVLIKAALRGVGYTGRDRDVANVDKKSYRYHKSVLLKTDEINCKELLRKLETGEELFSNLARYPRVTRSWMFWTGISFCSNGDILDRIQKKLGMDTPLFQLSKLKDTACAPLFTDLLAAEGEDDIPSLRVLEECSADISYEDIIGFVLNGFPDEQLNALLCAKEKEGKKTPRFFVCFSPLLRISYALSERLLESLIKDVLKDMSAFSQSRSEISNVLGNIHNNTALGKFVSVSINLDLSSWNLRFSEPITCATARVLDMADGLYDSDKGVGFHEGLARQFKDVRLYLRSPYVKPAPDTLRNPPNVHENRNPEGLGFIGHYGGLEGIRQKLWTIATYSILYDVASWLPGQTRFNILGVGDNQTLSISRSRHALRNQRGRDIVIGEELGELMELAKQTMDDLSGAYMTINQIMKPSESLISSSVIVMTKVLALNGVILPIHNKDMCSSSPISGSVGPGTLLALDHVYGACGGCCSNSGEHRHIIATYHMFMSLMVMCSKRMMELNYRRQDQVRARTPGNLDSVLRGVPDPEELWHCLNHGLLGLGGVGKIGLPEIIGLSPTDTLSSDLAVAKQYQQRGLKSCCRLSRLGVAAASCLADGYGAAKVAASLNITPSKLGYEKIVSSGLSRELNDRLREEVVDLNPFGCFEGFPLEQVETFAKAEASLSSLGPRMITFIGGLSPNNVVTKVISCFSSLRSILGLVSKDVVDRFVHNARSAFIDHVNLWKELLKVKLCKGQGRVKCSTKEAIAIRARFYQGSNAHFAHPRNTIASPFCQFTLTLRPDVPEDAEPCPHVYFHSSFSEVDGTQRRGPQPAFIPSNPESHLENFSDPSSSNPSVRQHVDMAVTLAAMMFADARGRTNEEEQKVMNYRARLVCAMATSYFENQGHSADDLVETFEVRALRESFHYDYGPESPQAKALGTDNESSCIDVCTTPAFPEFDGKDMNLHWQELLQVVYSLSGYAVRLAARSAGTPVYGLARMFCPDCVYEVKDYLDASLGTDLISEEESTAMRHSLRTTLFKVRINRRTCLAPESDQWDAGDLAFTAGVMMGVGKKPDYLRANHTSLDYGPLLTGLKIGTEVCASGVARERAIKAMTKGDTMALLTKSLGPPSSDSTRMWTQQSTGESFARSFILDAQHYEGDQLNKLLIFLGDKDPLALVRRIFTDGDNWGSYIFHAYSSLLMEMLMSHEGPIIGFLKKVIEISEMESAGSDERASRHRQFLAAITNPTSLCLAGRTYAAGGMMVSALTRFAPCQGRTFTRRRDTPGKESPTVLVQGGSDTKPHDADGKETSLLTNVGFLESSEAVTICPAILHMTEIIPTLRMIYPKAIVVGDPRCRITDFLAETGSSFILRSVFVEHGLPRHLGAEDEFGAFLEDRHPSLIYSDDKGRAGCGDLLVEETWLTLEKSCDQCTMVVIDVSGAVTREKSVYKRIISRAIQMTVKNKALLIMRVYGMSNLLRTLNIKDAGWFVGRLTPVLFASKSDMGYLVVSMHSELQSPLGREPLDMTLRHVITSREQVTPIVRGCIQDIISSIGGRQINLEGDVLSEVAGVLRVVGKMDDLLEPFLQDPCMASARRYCSIPWGDKMTKRLLFNCWVYMKCETTHL